VLIYALPAAGAFASMHAIVPPHPGPVTAATEIGASIGLTLVVGVVVAVIAWFVGVYLVTMSWLGKVYVPVDDSVLTGGHEPDADSHPAFGHVLAILLLPLVLIGTNTVLTTLRANGSIAEEGALVDTLIFIGQTPVALIIALLVAVYTLAIRRHSREEVETILNDSLGPICAIILITGAGGMFGGVLRYSGIGEALSDSLGELGLPLIVSAFVIATILRVAQGSATVALTTTAGLLSAAVAEADPSSLQLVALVLAIAAGATVLSHVNDSGFWLVSKFFGMDVKTTLRTWTVLETTLGVSIFVLSLGVWAIG
jgi:GntP family gluconate:H+ symporter